MAGVEIQFHAFLTLADSLSGRSNTGQSVPSANKMQHCMGTRSDTDAVRGDEKNPTPVENQTPRV
jgi:hypothetical protein